MLLEGQLAKLTNEIIKCESCHLKENRTQVVPGIYGSFNGICFVGEAPGFYEDQKGIPFVGRSGKLLDKMLEEIGLTRSDVSILNVVKCRPTTEDGGNRTPTESELRFCGEKWLFKQFELLSPKLIITLGGIALKFFIPKAKVKRRLMPKITFFLVLTYAKITPKAGAIQGPTAIPEAAPIKKLLM